MRQFANIAAAVILSACALFATIFGSVRGVVHDPQHRPIQGARLTLKAQNSDWARQLDSDENGGFEFTSVSVGNYTVTVSSPGFQQMQQEVIVQSDTSPVLHFQLALAGVQQSVAVSAVPVQATTDSVTPTTMLNREDIRETPGRRPHQRNGNDHRLRTGRLRNARHAAHARRPPGGVVGGWRSHPQHQYCLQSGAAD